MKISNRRDSTAPKPRRWLRVVHRWLGVISALFVLLLASTGIALNHSHDWQLDQRYVSWSWLLDAYGIHAPDISASFDAGGHRASLLGQRLYFDGRSVAQEIDSVIGMVSVDFLTIVATNHSIVLLTAAGELVEQLDLVHQLPGDIDRIGSWGGRIVINSAGEYFMGDAEVTGFEPLASVPSRGIDWSVPSVPPLAEIVLLQESFRGQGLSVERLLGDIHSGRIIKSAGALVMDLIAVFLIILSVTGLVLWLRRARRGNGGGQGAG